MHTPQVKQSKDKRISEQFLSICHKHVKPESLLINYDSTGSFIFTIISRFLAILINIEELFT